MSDFLSSRRRGYSANPFYGLYRGKVTNNQDPQGMGRVKLLIPKVLGSDRESNWALPCIPLLTPIKVDKHKTVSKGSYEGATFIAEHIHEEVEIQLVPAIPKVGQHVWVMFANGDIDQPVYLGTWWLPGGAPPVE